MTPPLGVYVHWPYCARICPYCDFNVYRTREVDAARWRRALAADLKSAAARTGARQLKSLYFGGGTPSLAPIDVVESVIEACDALWGFEPGVEITLEANPTDAESARFRAFKSAGVNRLSIGVQSFDDAALKFLKRNHDARAARDAVELGLDTFPRLTFDLIDALPGESPADWRKSLREALALGATHLSLYQLTIEPGTAFERAERRGVFTPAPDDRAADLFDIAQEETARAGRPAYEISNHAAPGAESRHNLLYWTGGDYVGIGPGAHGRLTLGEDRLAIETFRTPDEYLEAVESSASGVSSQTRLDCEARLIEKMTMGLRLSAGVAVDGRDRAALGHRVQRLDELVEEGLLEWRGERLIATPVGRRILNALLAAILA